MRYLNCPVRLVLLLFDRFFKMTDFATVLKQNYLPPGANPTNLQLGTTPAWKKPGAFFKVQKKCFSKRTT
jgi:hypothetical protein